MGLNGTSKLPFEVDGPFQPFSVKGENSLVVRAYMLLFHQIFADLNP